MGATVTIKHAAFAYFVEVDDPIRPGEKILSEQKAFQGERVNIPRDEDVQLGERFGAFLKEGEPAPGQDTEEEVGVSELTDEEIISWLKTDRPRIQEVIDAAEGDPALARRLLDAEDKATDGDSRRGVVLGLTAVMEGGE